MGLRVHFQSEIEKYQTELQNGNRQSAWRQLERAHIIGQPWPKTHTHIHWLMLKFGFRIKNAKEIVGQIPRLLVGGVKSFVGEIPVGNTGGADVPPLKPMEVPQDITDIMKPYYHVK